MMDGTYPLEDHLVDLLAKVEAAAFNMVTTMVGYNNKSNNNSR